MIQVWYHIPHFMKYLSIQNIYIAAQEYPACFQWNENLCGVSIYVLSLLITLCFQAGTRRPHEGNIKFNEHTFQV